MSVDHLYLLSVAGEDYFDQKEKLRRIRKAIETFCPKGAKLVIRENDHDFGPYPSLEVAFDPAVLASKSEIDAVYALEERAFRAADELGIES